MADLMFSRYAVMLTDIRMAGLDSGFAEPDSLNRFKVCSLFFRGLCALSLRKVFNIPLRRDCQLKRQATKITGSGTYS
ncbi:hypothetical protein GCM10011502_00720 [Oceanisphaera marina]|uniref:Transposase DDE domain-containing protein n=1 Tax=Oceanisphaera marina TaxID=2017550 RepID=A0ABQ1IAQ3_9GAMM|nr:hypothetical protein GCM10011502_00720 [Oceanisphaera marina]